LPTQDPASDVAIAIARGDPLLQPEHFILAMVRSKPPCRAASALRDCGVTHDVYARAIDELTATRATPAVASVPTSGRFMSGQARRVYARAEGFAAALGSTAIQPEHLLLAILYEPGLVAHTALERCGASRETLLDHLARRGVRVTSIGWPPRIAWGPTRYVSREEFEAIAEELRSAGVPYRFNYTADRVVLSVAEHTMPSHGGADRSEPSRVLRRQD
jgi:hypothetical protein